MKEIVHPKEIDNEQSRLKNISEQLGASSEKFSVSQAEQKLAERLEIGAAVEYSADENLDKKTIALKKEINEVLAERYNTSPEFEELRSKKKINRLTKFEETQYAYFEHKYPERAKISSLEQRRANLAYEDAKRNKVDFQIAETLRFYKREYEDAKIRGDALNPRESDLYDKLSDAYAEKIKERAEETIYRAETVLWRT